MISGGEPDAVVLPELFPGSRLTTVAAAGNMTGWSMPKEAYESEAMQKYMQAPGSAPSEIDINELREIMGDSWSFVSEDDTFRAFETIGGNVVHKDMDFEMAKALTAAVIANSDTFLKKAPYMATTQVGSVGLGLCGAVPVKYHPGSVAAYEEAGITVPDCAKP